MSKRRAPEAEVVRFFMTAQVDLAVTVYRIVKGILDQRGAFGTGKPTHRPRALSRRVAGPVHEVAD